MICVVVAADDKDKSFWRKLRQVLEGHFHVLLACERSLATQEASAELAVVEAEAFDTVQADSVLVVFKEVQSLPVTAGEAVAVVDSAKPPLVEHVAATGMPAITCGLSSRDTITLSSIGADSAVVNLQRTLTDFNGTVVEPQEIPVKLKDNTESFTVMSIASIFIMSGNIVRLFNIEI